ncbi:flavoprotein [Entomospira culicis]|uniref:Phosphopantothenoylcysteine decarboxylase n=1 Tax=Entomospira culicis TaxID=2719989 RepID=A0A968GF71_9SPIO|nr:flavoprotein [Entomospira culicis]NIZ18693.1 phosphopantothenoylcysteine decarboxylase [Entomospira culicis]NIZ68908.1 phosphopantothenoylcysteine decarboxylase [Entomospira culicis]WDI37501.1 flavoprotein [Entomospira culicis]WDI39129.1 flavoprotein [Entomospira culicis]
MSTTLITLGITGSIAAYKAADLASQLGKRGYRVQAMMTESAERFITPHTLQALTKEPVLTQMFDLEQYPHEIRHITLAKESDLLLIAPASANIIAKLAHGLADDLLSTFALVMDGTSIMLAPAMNTRMYQNPIVQNNIQILRGYGMQIIEPKSDLLACGDIGQGALATVDTILAHVDKYLDSKTE